MGELEKKGRQFAQRIDLCFFFFCTCMIKNSSRQMIVKNNIQHFAQKNRLTFLQNCAIISNNILFVEREKRVDEETKYYF